MISERQEHILNYLIQEYINSSEPVSSDLLNKRYNLGVSPATIRNDLQRLTEEGYINQPHTSAGRVPTNKAYRYFVTKIFTHEKEDVPEFIFKEIEAAKAKIEKELHLARNLLESLTEMSYILSFNRIEEDSLFYVLKIIGSKTVYERNIDIIQELLKELESF